MTRKVAVLLIVCVVAGTLACMHFLSGTKGVSKEHFIRHTPGQLLSPDTEADSRYYADLVNELPAAPSLDPQTHIFVMTKFFGNHYWQLIAEGAQERALELDVRLSVHAAASESDPEGQLNTMRQMIAEGCEAIILAPQTSNNLVPAVKEAREKGILLINIAEAGEENPDYFVGPRQYDAGQMAANELLRRLPSGGTVAVLRGQDSTSAAIQRTLGFQETIAGSRLQLAMNETADWDLQKARRLTLSILEAHPDLSGIYCNNDVMALGAVQAIQYNPPKGKIHIVGTDGIEPAYTSIREGAMAATIDSTPAETGRIAVEVAIRILGGQRLPRVIYSPQQLVTDESAER